MLAAVQSDLRLLRALIQAKIDVNRAHGGLTPLLAAVRDSYHGRPDAVMTLLANGADPRVAERFELYICGVELANGFGELIDPFEQKKRFEIEMNEKERIYGERYPIDEDFLAALAHMPPSSGVALGFDRLVMLATGARNLSDVIWTPVPD